MNNKTTVFQTGWNSKTIASETTNQVVRESDEYLDCGKSVNFTYYDNLVGVANRHNHPHVPEPQVAMIFKKKGTKSTEFDVNALERKLKKAKREVCNNYILIRFQENLFLVLNRRKYRSTEYVVYITVCLFSRNPSQSSFITR